MSRALPAILLAVALGTCGGKRPSSVQVSDTSETTVESTDAAPVSAQQPTRQPVRVSRRVLGSLPRDRSVVFHASWSRIQESEIYMQHRAKLLAALEEPLKLVRAKCAFDPLLVLDTVSVAMGSDIQRPDDLILAVSGRFGQSQIESCIARLGGSVKEGVYANRGDSMNAYWPAEDMVLLSEKLSAAEMKSALERGTLRQNRAFMSLVARTDSHAALWGAGILASSSGGGLGPAAKLPRSFHLTANLLGVFDLVLGMEFASADDASGLVAGMRMILRTMVGQSPALKDLGDATNIELAGNRVLVDMQLSAQQVAEIMELIN